MGYPVIQVRWRTPDVSIQHMHISPDQSASAMLNVGRERCARLSRVRNQELSSPPDAPVHFRCPARCGRPWSSPPISASPNPIHCASSAGYTHLAEIAEHG